MNDIRIINSVPDLQIWMNQHPSTLDDYLFPILPEMTKFSKNGVRNMLTAAAKRAKIDKKVYPHLFRHSKITQMHIDGMSETQLKHYAGWKKKSNMPAVYIHLSESNVDDKVLEIAGIKKEEVQEKKSSIKICPFCKTKNPFDIVYCMNCSRILDKTKAIDPYEKIQKENKKIQENMEIRMLEVERDAYIRPDKMKIRDLQYKIGTLHKYINSGHRPDERLFHKGEFINLSLEEIELYKNEIVKIKEEIEEMKYGIQEIIDEYQTKINALKNS